MSGKKAKLIKPKTSFGYFFSVQSKNFCLNNFILIKNPAEINISPKKEPLNNQIDLREEEKKAETNIVVVEMI